MLAKMLHLCFKKNRTFLKNYKYPQLLLHNYVFYDIHLKKMIPIGSGLGIQNPVGIRLIVEQSKVPVLVDAGVGTASEAAEAMELGCDGVLMNTAIAEAKNPVRMARAMKHAVKAGRYAYLAGRMPRKLYADPSSPLSGLI